MTEGESDFHNKCFRHIKAWQFLFSRPKQHWNDIDMTETPVERDEQLTIYSSTHLPAVTSTLSTASVRSAEVDLGPLARNINRKSRSTFLKVTWARTQVLRSGLSCWMVTLPGLPRYGQASTVRVLSLPSGNKLKLLLGDKYFVTYLMQTS